MSTAEQPSQPSAAATTEPKAPQSIRLDLVPRPDVAQTIYANQALARGGQGVVLIDFGYAEPGLIDVIARRAQAGQQVPPSIEGNLGARLALSPDAASALHAQLGQLLQQARAAAEAAARTVEPAKAAAIAAQAINAGKGPVKATRIQPN